jgi:hypothetical protein
MRVIRITSVVPAKAGTHTPRTLERIRSMGPGSRSFHSLGRDDFRARWTT